MLFVSPKSCACLWLWSNDSTGEIYPNPLPSWRVSADISWRWPSTLHTLETVSSETCDSWGKSPLSNNWRTLKNRSYTPAKSPPQARRNGSTGRWRRVLSVWTHLRRGWNTWWLLVCSVCFLYSEDPPQIRCTPQRIRGHSLPAKLIISLKDKRFWNLVCILN